MHYESWHRTEKTIESLRSLECFNNCEYLEEFEPISEDALKDIHTNEYIETLK